MTPNAMPQTTRGSTITCPCGATITMPVPADLIYLYAAVHHRWHLTDDGTMTCRTCKENQ